VIYDIRSRDFIILSFDKLVNIFADIVGYENIKLNEPMKYHTSFKIGGPADILITPVSVEMLEKVLEICKSEGVPYFIMGNGTNLLVKDKGIRGVVVKTSGKLKNFIVNNNYIEAEAGLLLPELSKIACENGLSGLEFASGIPGTLGGAIVMNAGAYGKEIKDVVIKTYYLTNEGELKIITKEEHQFGYRTSIIQKQGGIVLKSIIKFDKETREKILEKIKYFNAERRKSQPIDMPSAGSVFKKPDNYHAAALIEELGLKGFNIGGAQISTKHCGFIVNKGNATAKDVICVINHVQEKVKNVYGINLETEVKIVGEE